MDIPCRLYFWKMHDRQTNTTYTKVGHTTQPVEVRLQQELSHWIPERYIFTECGSFEFSSVQDAKRHEEAIKWRLRNFLPENFCDRNGRRRTEYFIDNNKKASEICDKYLYENEFNINVLP